MPNINMEEIDSHLISHRGHDADSHIMAIRFRTKTGVPGALYNYGNVSPALYEEGLTYLHEKTGEVSFGSWFGKVIKADPKRYPFHKMEEVGGCPTIDSVVDGKAETTDFASGQPIPATTAEVLPPIPDDVEELKKEALALKDKAALLVVKTPEDCERAMLYGTAIARMQGALEKTLRPGINEKHKAWKAELDVLNFFNTPLETIKEQLKKGIVAFRQEQRRVANIEAQRIREEQQRIAEAEARQRAEQLKLDDAVEAEQRGEVELAESIMAAPALPLAPAYVPPVYVPTNVPNVRGTSHREKWEFEIVDINLIPREYFMLDEKAIGKVVTSLKNRTNIPGIRAYDAGNVAFSKK